MKQKRLKARELEQELQKLDGKQKRKRWKNKREKKKEGFHFITRSNGEI